MARFARLGRLYKLVKLTRLIRVLKIIKDKTKFMRIFTDLLKVGRGMERLFFFGILSLILCHIVSCLWIMLPSFIIPEDDETFQGTWIEPYISLEDGSLYVTSLFWTIQTITTVGYGDISGIMPSERLFNIIIMFVGVISFSFANASLASILSNYDNHHVELANKIATLNKLYKEFQLPLDLYIDVKKELEFNQTVASKTLEVQGFIDKLPHKLKI